METSNYFSKITEETLKYCTLREEDIVLLKRLKNTLVRSQLYPEAAALLDIEKQMTLIINAMEEHGFKPKPMPISEKFYSIEDVNLMLTLATAPLKKAITHYEELSRSAIVDYVASLIKQNHELCANQKPTETNGKENEAAGTE